MTHDLHNGTTEILWDTYGVPHIIAPDHRRLFHAYGYAQMEAHSELLLSLYAQAQGRGAEFFGADGSASGSSPGSADSLLEADRWVRTNGVPTTAKQWAATQRYLTTLRIAWTLRVHVPAGRPLSD